MKFDLKRKFKALTLIETIVYLAIFSFMITLVIQFVFVVDKGNDVGLSRVEMEKQVIYLGQHLADSFETSVSINETNTVLNDSNGILYLNHNGTYIEYTLNNGVIEVDRGSGKVPITTPEYTVTNFLLEPVRNAGGTLAGIRVHIDLEEANDPNITRSLVTFYRTKL